ncbi:MAG: acyl-ACP--UDP-N-acetylglucosamine O-acyltransferase [bacterium]
MTKIHQTAIVSPLAKLGENVEVGPYAVIYDDVEIGDGTSVGPHTCIYDGARIGKNVKLFQSVSVANAPQDLKYANERTYFYIGDNTVIHEFVTLHRGTVETGFSKIGSNCLLMACSHVAHDTVVGDNVIIANAVLLAGHVLVEDWVILGGLTPVHQFCKVGKYSMIGGAFRITYDVPPYVLAAGEPIKFMGLNLIGLKRRGFTSQQIQDIKNVYFILYLSKLNFSDAKRKIKDELGDNWAAKEILTFFETSTRPGFKA